MILLAFISGIVIGFMFGIVIGDFEIKVKFKD